MSVSIVQNGVRKVVADTSTMALSNLATIEGTTTASKTYAVGDFLVLAGQLYKVTQAIAQGGTITVDTNVVADSVGSELSALNTHLNEYSYKPFLFPNVVFTNGYATVNTGITGYTSFIPIVDNHGTTTKVVYESVNNGVVTLMATRYIDGSVASYTESEIHMIVAYK